jgi:hypothetical protein
MATKSLPPVTGINAVGVPGFNGSVAGGLDVPPAVGRIVPAGGGVCAGRLHPAISNKNRNAPDKNLREENLGNSVM